MTDIARVIKGAATFGVKLRLNSDDVLVYDARYEPSEGILERISEHKAAITALLKARSAPAAINWDKLGELTVDEYEALARSVAEDLEALQNSLDKLERAAAAILPTMRNMRCTGDAAVKALLAEKYNTKYARLRPKRFQIPSGLPPCIAPDC